MTQDTQGRTTEYNWHPQVHSHFGEALWFFLIRFKDPTFRTVKDQLNEALEQAGISHACRYTLYGYWDGLIRVWMTDSLKRRFLRVLKKDEVEDVRRFQVSSLYYMWHDPETDLLDIDSEPPHSGPPVEIVNAFEERIEAVKGDSSCVPDDDLAELTDNALLLQRPGWPDGGVKFYVTLDRTGSQLKQAAEVAIIHKAVEQAGLADRCSLYVGDGFARYLLRCAADDFNSVMALTEEFYDQLRDAHSVLPLRPTTFVIIEPSGESDNLNFSLSIEEEQTVDRLELTVEGRARFEDMSHSERSRVHRLIVRIDALSLDDDRLRSRLAKLLKACIEEDRGEVRSSLMFLLDLEPLFQEFIFRVWSSRYKDDWPKTLVNRLTTSTPDSDLTKALNTPPSRWTFGVLHKLAAESGRNDPEVQAALVRELGDDWHGQVMSLVELRNFAAHNEDRPVERLSELNGSWGDRVEAIINSAEMYFLLDSLRRRKDIENDAY